MLRRPQRTLTLVWALWGTFFVASPSDARFLVSGSQQDRATWNQMLQQCSNASTSFASLVSRIRGGSKTVRIVLVRNVGSVVVDQAPVAGAGRNANKVDLSDIEDLAELDPPKVVDRCQIIAHFLEERWQLACGKTFRTAHLAGIDAENAWRADRGYTDRISKAPVSGGWIGHGPSSDGKKACHFWTDGDTTYDPIPGERTESGVFAQEVEPGARGRPWG